MASSASIHTAAFIDTDERRVAADAARLETYERLRADAGDWKPDVVTDANFLTCAAMWLERHNARVTLIDASRIGNQKFEVTVVQTHWDTETRTLTTPLSLQIECHRVEDAIVLAIDMIITDGEYV